MSQHSWSCLVRCFPGPGAEVQLRPGCYLHGEKVRGSTLPEQPCVRGGKATWGRGLAPAWPVARRPVLSALGTFCIWLEMAQPVWSALCLGFPIPRAK